MVIVSDSGIVTTTEKQKMWLDEMERGHILYFGGYSGLGKTSQAEFLAEKYYRYWKTADARSTDLSTDYREWKASAEEQKGRKLFILDNLTYLNDEKQIEQIKIIVGEILEESSMDLILIGRANCPAWLRSYYLDGKQQNYKAEYFLLDQEETSAMVTYELERVAKCFSKKPEKWLEDKVQEINENFEEKVPLALSYYLRFVKESGGEAQNLKKRTNKLLWEHIEKESKENFDEESKTCLEKAAVMKNFDDDMLGLVLHTEERTLFYHLMEISSYITKDDNGIYRITEFFQNYAQTRLKELQKDVYYEMMENVADCYVGRKRYQEALELYRKCGCKKKLAHLLTELTARCDGTEYPKICYGYLADFSEEDEKQYPCILYVKIILYSMFLHPKKSNKCLEKLRKIADEERIQCLYGEGRKNYVQALLCMPHQKKSEYQDVMQIYMDVRLNDDEYKSRMQPTGGGPSIINGGIDLMDWSFENKDMYAYMKNITGYLMGEAGEPLADIGMGEYYLEKNDRLKAIGSLVSGMSQIKKKENFREYYTANAVIARTFVEDNRLQPAKDVAMRMMEQVMESDYPELYGNVCATYIEFCLYEGMSEELKKWAEYEWSKGVGNIMNADFSVADRYRLYVLIKVYMSMERYAGAAMILSQLMVYAQKYGRKYFQIRLMLLNAALSFCNGEDGQEELIKAVILASKRGFVRVIADEGAAVLPVWKKVDWEKVAKMQEEPVEKFMEFIHETEEEMKKMAAYYPQYLRKKQTTSILSKSEKQVLHLIYNGRTNEKIAEELSISLSTVKFHVSNILRKLNVKNRNQAVKKAREIGEIM